MSDVMKDFKNKFRTDELIIYESKYWIWSLRPIQTTLGAGILSLKLECPAFSELNQDEFSDLSNIIKKIEKTLKESFSYDIMNYLMPMLVDKQVHYHVIPRYERSIFFNGVSWKDSEWPGLPVLSGKESEINVLKDIQNEIREKLSL